MKKYFASIDDNICQDLEVLLRDAKIEGLKEITLIEAVRDESDLNNIWCSYDAEVTDISMCCKSRCAFYESKSGKGVCKFRGTLYTYGKTVKFKVK